MKQSYITCSSPLSPTTWVSVLLAVLLFPLGLSLPAWCGWENGPIENMQVVVLAIGAVVSFAASRRNQTIRQLSRFWLWSVPLWLLLIGRELSWGRVFYPAPIGSKGPMTLTYQQLGWSPHFHILLHVVIAGIALISLYELWHNFDWQLIKPTLAIPAVDLVLLCLAASGAEIIFERNIFTILKPYGQVLEELSELIAYWCLVSITANVGVTNIHPQKTKTPFLS